MVVEPVSAIRMEYADVFKASLNGHECLFYMPGCFMRTNAVSDDFAVKEVHKYTYVISAGSNPDIGRISGIAARFNFRIP